MRSFQRESSISHWPSLQAAYLLHSWNLVYYPEDQLKITKAYTLSTKVPMHKTWKLPVLQASHLPGFDSCQMRGGAAAGCWEGNHLISAKLPQKSFGCLAYSRFFQCCCSDTARVMASPVYKVAHSRGLWLGSWAWQQFADSHGLLAEAGHRPAGRRIA